jgi:hypothetical protein|nr:MAG TPA: hypothetical protein [Caudoviricetes sp.]
MDAASIYNLKSYNISFTEEQLEDVKTMEDLQ